MSHVMKKILHKIGFTRVMASVFCVGVLLFFTSAAYAQMQPPEPTDVCTDGPQFSTELTGPGVFTKITSNVTTLTATLGETIFNTIQGNPGFSPAVGAAATLYVAIYAILFMTGQVRVSAQDFVIRCIKISLMAVLLSGNAWIFFNTYVASLFNTLTNEFIGELARITVGGNQLGGQAAFPMDLLDTTIAKIISANMAVHLLAMLFAPPYGFFYLILIIIALWSFISLLLTAIWVYLTAIVFRGLLIGLAPIFIVCLLFTKTKHLFDGWMNQLLSSCLQPILLFSFLSFFILMSVGTTENPGLIDEILGVPVCWTAASESFQGSPFNVHYWRFTVANSEWDSGFEPYGGKWSWGGATDAPSGSPPFPIKLWPVLCFLILAELGKRFGQMVLMIARDLSASSVDLSDMKNIMSGLMPSGGGAGGQSAAAVSNIRQGAAKEGAAGAFKRTFAKFLGNG